MFGKSRELLPKDVLEDLESNPSRVDEMLEKIVNGDANDPLALGLGEQTFITAIAMSSPGVGELERALRMMEMQQQQLAGMQNQQFIGGFQNGSSIGNALGGLGGLLGPRAV